MSQQIPKSTLKKLQRAGKLLNALASVSPSLAGKLAFRIFCTPRRIPLRDKDREFLQSASTYTLHLEGLRIQTYTWEAERPDARTLLFLHGWESNAARWYKYIKSAQAAGYRVLALDAPASGYSSGNLLNVLIYSRVIKKLTALLGRPYAIVGHSLGGAAAVMSLALLETQPPQKMVVLASFAESTRVIRDFAQILGANERVVNAIFRHIEQRSGVPVEEYSVRKKAATLQTVSGLVMHDLHDEVAPVAEGRAIAEAWGCRFLQTEGYGHRMQDNAVINALMEFLEGG
jgi:pimeloyl-ACP methyl ester carboxylesterase